MTNFNVIKTWLINKIIFDLLVFQLVPNSDGKRTGFFSHLTYEKQIQRRTIFSIFFFMDDERLIKRSFYTPWNKFLNKKLICMRISVKEIALGSFGADFWELLINCFQIVEFKFSKIRRNKLMTDFKAMI